MKNQKGTTLVEVLVALTILGITGTGFLYSMTDLTEATPRVDDKVTALSLAESQMEYIRSQPFQQADAGGGMVYNLIPEDDRPAGFNIVTPMAIPWDANGDGIDDAFFEKLRVQVWVPTSSGSKVLITLEEYRAQ